MPADLQSPSADLVHPWTRGAQEIAVTLVGELGALLTSPERLLAWNTSTDIDRSGRCVVYWMQRAQRGRHNPALDTAIAAGRALDLPVVMLFRCCGGPVGTELRHVEWMHRGLRDAFADAAKRGVAGVLLGYDAPPLAQVLGAGAPLHASLVITDDDVMPRARRGRRALACSLVAPVISVDVDVVVPGACFQKQEYAARTLRPRLHRVLEQFAHDVGDAGDGALSGHARTDLKLSDGVPPRIPDAHVFDPAAGALTTTDVDDLLTRAARSGTADVARPLPTVASGSRAGGRALARFVEHGLDGYATRRNKPELDATSGLSRFLHLGQLSPGVVLAAVRTSGAPADDIASFAEELVVRRELAYNFVRWNPRASELAGAERWARATLSDHARDARHIIPFERLEAADTPDPLWNAAQRQMVTTGHMHGYLRMYWAKQLLLWTPSPEAAFDVALTLNDRWSLDGRDPNGITGVAWAIAGVHDRAWTEREVFGKIRCMTLASTGRKFDSRRYIERWS